MTTEPRFGMYCESCGFVDDDERSPEDFPPTYECGSCGETYSRDDSADGESNRCPSCNKFGAKTADHGCPDCGESLIEGDIPANLLDPPAPPVVTSRRPATPVDPNVRDGVRHPIDLNAVTVDLTAIGIDCDPQRHFSDPDDAQPYKIDLRVSDDERPGLFGRDFTITPAGDLTSTTMPIYVTEDLLARLIVIDQTLTRYRTERLATLNAEGHVDGQG